MQQRTVTEDFIDDGGFVKEPQYDTFGGRVQLPDGRSAYTIVVAPPGGLPETVALDTGTLMIDRLSYDDRDGTSTSDYYQYRVFHGVLVAQREVDSNGDHAYDLERLAEHIGVDRTFERSIFAVPSNTQVQTSKPVTVPLEEHQRHYYTRVSIHGRQFTFLVDTGAQAVVLDTKAAAQLGLQPQGHLEVSGARRMGGMGIAPLDGLQIGSATLPLRMVTIIDLGNVAGSFHADGVLGYPFFASAEVQFDAAGRTMTFAKPGTLPARGEVFPINVDRELVEMHGKVNGVAGRFVLDTGNNSELLLFSPFVNTHPGLLPTGERQFANSYGVGGSTQAFAVTIDELDMGSYRFFNRYANVILAQQGAFADRFDAGNIGMGVLRNLIVTFDVADAKVYATQSSVYDDGRFRSRTETVTIPYSARLRRAFMLRPMTISEHLNFSVLSAPIAAIDRRALSQAWYCALFGDRSSAPLNAPRALAPSAQSATGPGRAPQLHCTPRSGADPARTPAKRLLCSRESAVPSEREERRAERSQTRAKNRARIFAPASRSQDGLVRAFRRARAHSSHAAFERTQPQPHCRMFSESAQLRCAGVIASAVRAGRARNCVGGERPGGSRMISDATMRAMSDITARERDVLLAYTPGAVPERDNVAQSTTNVWSTDPLSSAPPENAYFVARDAEGRTLYTRDGSFHLKDGALLDSAGMAVVGYTDASQTLQPLRADRIDASLGYAASARIERDGCVTYDRLTVDPFTGRRETQRIVLGRLALARFTAGTKLQVAGAQHFSAPPGTAPHVGRARDGNFGELATNARTGSGVDLDSGLQRLQEAYLAFDAIRAAGKAQGGLDKTAMDLLK